MASFHVMFWEKMSEAIDKADKEEIRTAVAMLRALRGWSQADLALAAGLGASAVSRYESGAQEPSPRTFDRIVSAVGLTPPLVRTLLYWIRKARAEVRGRTFHNPLKDAIEMSAMELAEAFSAMLYSAVADLEASGQVARPDHRTPEELWKEIQEVPAEALPAVIEAVEELQSWQFCAFLCDKSLEAAGNGNGAEALRVARLAVRSAEMSGEPGIWKLRLKGYAVAHLAAALRALGDLDAAEEARQRARTLWNAGEPGDLMLLDEERLRELDSSWPAPPTESEATAG